MLYLHGQWVNESCVPKVFITFFSRIARHKRLKQYKIIKMKNKYNVLCVLKSGCSYFFIPLFLPFSISPIFSLYSFIFLLRLRYSGAIVRSSDSSSFCLMIDLAQNECNNLVGP